MPGDLLEGFTILIPTYNSEGRIRRCLESVRRQDYPLSRVQILIADGGSTDRTREIAETYGATVIDNPLRLAEEGLRAAMPHVRREHVVIFADDNEFAQDSWLSSVDEIFHADQDVSAFFCRLGASDDDPAVNKYYALVESEPLSFYLNRNLRRYLASAPVGRAREVCYQSFDVNPRLPLVWGANGLTYRTEIITPIWDTEAYLGDNDAFQLMVEGGHGRVAYTRELCVYHHHVKDLWSWRKKWSRNFSQHFLPNIGSRNLDWLLVPHFKTRLLLWTFYSLVPVVSIPVAVYRAVRDSDWHWLYHPAASFLQAATYIGAIASSGWGEDGFGELMRQVVSRKRPGG